MKKNKVKIVIFGHGIIAIRLIEKLIKSKKYDLLFVILSGESLFNPSLEKFCELKKIRYYKKFPSKKFKNLIGLSVLYDKIITKKVINKFKTIVNCHYSLLPNFRGINPVNWALKLKKQIGLTLHTIDSDEIDKGNIIYQKRFNFKHQDIFFIYNHLHIKALDMYETYLKNYPKKIFQKKKNINIKEFGYYDRKKSLELKNYNKYFFTKNFYRQFNLENIKNKNSSLIINDKFYLKKINSEENILFITKQKTKLPYLENTNITTFKSYDDLYLIIKKLIFHNIMFNKIDIDKNIKIDFKLSNMLKKIKNNA